MSVWVLANVGKRDVAQAEGEGEEERLQALQPPRLAGQRLLERYPEGADRLRFPIIAPCLRYIAAQHEEGIDRLVLYGTDQEDPEHRDTDTLHFARLAARRLPDLLGGQLRGAEEQIVRGINPALYDEALERYDELLAGLRGLEGATCYVIIAGGTPACNTALLLQGVRHCGDRLRVVYLPQGGEPQELRAGQQVMDAFREAAAVEHLQRLDFANALPRLERLGAGRDLIALTAYAAQRLAFDFASAQEALLQALRDGRHSTRSLIQGRLRHDLDDLLLPAGGPGRLAALLRELYWNAESTWLHRRYADFLGRVYRFQEAVLRYLVERLLGLPTDLQPAVREAHLARWAGEIRANPHLLAYLEAQEIDGQPLDWTRINRPSYKALLSYATHPGGLDRAGQPLLQPGEGERYRALLGRVNAFDALVELRHRTIIGHDFQGVSEAQILASYSGGRHQDGTPLTPVEGLAQILGMLYIDVRADPYRAVADFVIAGLNEGQ